MWLSIATTFSIMIKLTFTVNPIFRVTLSDGFFGYQVINEKKMVK